MNPFAELDALVRLRSEEDEFPSWLVPELLEIAGHPDRYADRMHQVGTLVEQVRGFDPYAGVGCFATSVSAEAILATIRRLNSALE